MIKLKKELAIISDRVGPVFARNLNALLTEVEKMPVNTCAAVIHPRIIYDASIRDNPPRRAAFILVHEYLHLMEHHGVLATELMQDGFLKRFNRQKRVEIILWALELWTNIGAYMKLGYKPEGVEIDQLDIACATMPGMTVRKWVEKKAGELACDKKACRGIETRMENCYGQCPSKRVKPIRKKG